MMYTVEIPLKPVPKARPRVSGGHAYTPTKTKRFESDVATMVRCKMLSLGHKMIKSGVYVSLTFNFRAPTSALVGCPNYTTTSDVDNLIKSILDALNGVSYVDDRQVVQVFATKRWAESDGVVVTVSDEPFSLCVVNR